MKNYFTYEEILCPCCGKQRLNQKFLDKLNLSREDAGISFPANSMCRCANHNHEVGGKSWSSHLIDKVDGTECESFAADISTIDSASRFKILRSLFKIGFRRIGIYETFIHVDDDPSRTPERSFIGK